MPNRDRLKFYDVPLATWLLGFAALGGALYFYSFQGFSGNTILLGVIGLIILSILRGLTITADRNARVLRLHYWALYLWQTTREIPFDEIAAIRVDSMVGRDDDHHESRSYRIDVIRKDNSIVPFRKYYSGGFLDSLRKQKIVDQLRAFIGLGESPDQRSTTAPHVPGGGTVDGSPVGFMRAIPQAAAAIAATQQETLTGPNTQERVTNGVHWQIQSVTMGAAPVTRWYSPDFKMSSGFLFVAQKVSGQATSGVMAALGKALFRQSIVMYGFKADDTPNIAQAVPLAPVPKLIDFHFTAFTNNQAEARQILNPWAQNPLAEWAQRHPLQMVQSGGSISQLVVLFSPNGVYIATLGILQPEQVEELTNLGVEMVRTQGAVPA